MPVYSHSRLGTYETCPLQYKYRYVDRIKKDRETIEAFLGKRVHETLEKLYRDLKVTKMNSLGDLLTFYNDDWRKNWSENVEMIKKDYTAENYRKLGEKCIRDYYRKFYPFDQTRTLGLEQQIFINLDERGEYRLMGFIDRLAQGEDGVLEIHDYKTGQTLPTQEKVDQDRQLALYQIGIQQQWPDVKGVRLVWHYLAFDRQLVSERSPSDLAQVREQTIQVIREVESAKDFPPRESAICPWCEFVDICPLMKHLRKVEVLPVHEYLNETGVTLVNRYAEISTKKNDLVKQMDEELEKIKEALIAYAEKEGVEVVHGSDYKLKIKGKEVYKFPLKDDPRRGALERLVREAGEWEKFSDLNLNALSEAVQSDQLPDALKEKVLKFTDLEKSYRFYLSRLREK
ncbi:MAG: PD-(D/E)XK nuclease family protein [Chlamydiae bacterium]|nr:PD-(D/E)XK nuclease family protein [Chlamydiota bacterium]MBI3266443.1 PD-(D/E)XK nuclease family protein [Chlamydiota bacterium]